jgi:hypothetical protein
MVTSDEPSVRRRDRPIGICPRCHAVIRAFDQLGSGLAKNALGLREFDAKDEVTEPDPG